MARGRETSALLTLRNAALVSMTTLCWASHLLLATMATPKVNVIEGAFLVLASIAFCLALALIRRPWVLWVSFSGLVLLALPALLPSDGAQWLYSRFVIGQAGFILITMLPRRWGLVVVVSTPIVIRLLWAIGSPNVASDGYTIAFGVIPVLQLLACNVLVWWVWHGLLARSASADEQLARLQDEEFQARAEHERAAAWWTSTSQVHKTVLNSINALVMGRSINPQSAVEWAEQARASVAVSGAIHDESESRAATGTGGGPHSGPPLAQATESPSDNRFDGAQSLLSAGFAGLIIAGSSYVFFLHQASAARELISRVLVIAGTATAIAIVVRGRQVTPVWGTLLILAPSALPWVLASAAADCSQVPTLASVLSISGYTISIIAICGRLVPYAVAIPLWGTGSFLLAVQAPAACQRSLFVMMFNAVSIIPLIVIATRLGMRSSRESAARLDAARRRAATAVGRADAHRRVNEQITESVVRSAELMTEAGERGYVTQEVERDLACQVAMLRAGISVDLDRDGAFTTASYGLIQALSNAGIPVRVLTLAGSLDRRPLPSALTSSLAEAILAQEGQIGISDVSIACVGGQSVDFMSVMLPWSIAQCWWLEAGRELDEGAPRADPLASGALRLGVHRTEQRRSDGEWLGIITVERGCAVDATTDGQPRALVS